MPRHAISSEERRAIRRWYSTQIPKPRQIDVIRWFEQNYGRELRQSTISESLSDRYSFLDTDATGSGAYRQRSAQWPILESLLFEWYQNLEQQGELISGDDILDKAREIWPQIPEYTQLPSPNFSQGWLSRFKNRHSIRQQNQQDTIESLQESGQDSAEIAIRAIQDLCGQYPQEDIYSMSEAGLFWRLGLSNAPDAQSPAGFIPKDKSRVSFVCCCNYTGTRRFPLWIIGRTPQPLAHHDINMQALGCEWHADKRAWMGEVLMAEWLKTFYYWIQSKRSILLLNNSSAHIGGVELAPPPSNVKIQWLPENSLGLYQPLNQDIIPNLKTNFKRYWLQYIIRQHEQLLNPYKTMNLYYAVRWLSRAWIDVTDTTIFHSFRNAETQSQQESVRLPVTPLVPIAPLFEQAQAISRVVDPVSLNHFLSPEDEDAPPSEMGQSGHADEMIVEHSGYVDEEQDDDAITVPVPSTSDALQAIELLLRYQEHRQQATAEDMSYLYGLEQAILTETSSTMYEGNNR